MGHSDAKKRGDLLDGILFGTQWNKEHDYPRAIDDYPENIAELLKIFCKIWMLPEGIIPFKKRESEYKEWVLQLTQLSLLVSSDKEAQEAMQLAYNKYELLNNKFIVARPKAIRRIFADAIGQLNREKRKTKEERIATPESIKKAIQNLKSDLKEEE